MNQVDNLYDHYKDTYVLCKKAQEDRNKAFVVLCILEALLFMMIIRSEKAIEVFMQIINKDATNPINLGQMVVQTLLWTLVLYVFMRYCQLNIYVERQYKYLSAIENELVGKGLKISREGKSYNENYPLVLCVIDFLYKWFFPILFLSINVARIFTEIYWNMWSISIVCDVLIAIATVCLSISYILTLHPINIKKSQGGR